MSCKDGEYGGLDIDLPGFLKKGKGWGKKVKEVRKKWKRGRAKDAKKIAQDEKVDIPANGKKGILVPRKSVKKISPKIGLGSEPRRKSMNQERLTTMLSSKVLYLNNLVGSKGPKIKTNFLQIVEKSVLSQKNLDVNARNIKSSKITPKGSHYSGVPNEPDITTKSSVSAVTHMFMKSPRTGSRRSLVDGLFPLNKAGPQGAKFNRIS
jgi:hypothetical protein